ncbi:hypothetical protein CRUP_003128 [Coryphaenoides rupestris]|nr:hypothetical protein CRUP_003128 [Coryphaenoides rupestris]
MMKNSRSLGGRAAIRDHTETPGDHTETPGDTLRLRVTTLRLRVTTLRLRVDTLRLRVDTLRLRVTTLRLRVTTLRLRVDTLRLRVDTLRLRVTTLRLRVTTLRLRGEFVEDGTDTRFSVGDHACCIRTTSSSGGGGSRRNASIVHHLLGLRSAQRDQTLRFSRRKPDVLSRLPTPRTHTQELRRRGRDMTDTGYKCIMQKSKPGERLLRTDVMMEAVMRQPPQSLLL